MIVRIEGHAANVDGVLRLPRIPPGQRQVARFSVHGEATYVLRATTEDGRVLPVVEGHVEPGYRVEHHLTVGGAP